MIAFLWSDGPEIFWIFDNSTTSISPNLEKSISFNGANSNPKPPAVLLEAVKFEQLGFDNTDFIYNLISSFKILFLGPVPFTNVKSTPYSLANLLILGDA